MTRLISGIVLAAAALAAVLFLPVAALRWLAAAVGLLATHEFLRVARPHRAGLSLAYVFVAATVLYMSAPMAAERVWFAVIAALFACAAMVLFRGDPVTDQGLSLFAALYIGVPLALLLAVRELGGREAVLLLIATIVVSDSAQYYTGRAFGRRPLAPAISPKKTLEGAAGGLVIATLFFTLAGRAILPFARPAVLAATGAGIVIAGIAGDLFESRLKRAADLKDSSTLIPGHGGVLDRIDALLLAAPIFYLFLHEVM